MAGKARRVLEVALEETQAQSKCVAGKVNRQKKTRGQDQQAHPQGRDQAGLEKQLPGPADAPRRVGMMGQMPVAPESLRNSKQQGLVGGKGIVPKPLPEERQVNEVVGNGI